MDLLNRMRVGESIWEVPFKKAHSIRNSGIRKGLKIQMIQLPSGNYVICKLSE